MCGFKFYNHCALLKHYFVYGGVKVIKIFEVTFFFFTFVGVKNTMLGNLERKGIEAKK